MFAGAEACRPSPSPADAVLAALDELDKAKDKRAPSFRRLHEVAATHAIDILLGDDGAWQFLRAGAELAHTAGTRTRLDVVFPVQEDQPLEIHPAVEKLARGAVTVDGKDLEALVRRVEERFGGGA